MRQDSTQRLRSVLRSSPSVFALLVATLLVTACGGRGEPKNVVLITFDALRNDHLPFFGYERNTAPHLTWLVEGGILFDRVIPAGCSTKVSLTSLYTGLDYSGHGRLGHGDVLPQSHLTLAERFRAAGFETAGFVGSPHVAAQFGYDQGFDRYEDRWHRVDELGPPVIELLESRHPSEQPFFLYVHLKEPHPPWENDSPWLRNRDSPTRFFNRGCTYIPSTEEIQALDERTRHDLIARYDGAILRADKLLGSIVRTLREQELLDETVIGMGTDHGLELLDHYSASHGMSPFEEVTRNFIALWGADGLVPGTRSSVQARNFDLGPTAMAAAGLEPPADIDGVDLVEDAKRLPDTAFTFCYDAEVVRRNNLKMIMFHREKSDRVPPGFRMGPHLFDLAADPVERRIITGQHRQAVSDMRRALTAHLERAAEVARAVASRVEDEEIDPRLLRQLEALGYIDSSG